MIQITFTPETPEQTAAVAEAMVKYMAATAPGGTVAEVKDPAAEAPKRKSKSEPAVAKDSASATGEAEVPNDTSPERITLEDIRGVLAKLSQGGKAAEVKGLIAKFKASKLTEISADKYAEVLAAAKEL